MPWYTTQDNNKKFHMEIVPNLVESQEGMVTDGTLVISPVLGSLAILLSDTQPSEISEIVNKYLEKNIEKVISTLKENKMEYLPAPLIKSQKLFKIYRDEL